MRCAWAREAKGLHAPTSFLYGLEGRDGERGGDGRMGRAGKGEEDVSLSGWGFGDASGGVRRRFGESTCF